MGVGVVGGNGESFGKVGLSQGIIFLLEINFTESKIGMVVVGLEADSGLVVGDGFVKSIDILVKFG